MVDTWETEMRPSQWFAKRPIRHLTKDRHTISGQRTEPVRAAAAQKAKRKRLMDAVKRAQNGEKSSDV